MELKFLQPIYYKDFSCIGPACKQNCCDPNWDIYVDKTTFENYKKLKQPPEVVEKIKNYLKEMKSESENKVNHGVILHEEEPFTSTDPRFANNKGLTNSFCPFITKEKLCCLYAEFGEKGQSYICKTFPRKSVTIRLKGTDNFENIRSTEAKCEEVCRLLDEIPEPLSFEYIVEAPRNFVVSGLIAPKEKNEFALVKEFDLLRSTSITILQLRSVPLSERMILLGFYLDIVNDLVKEGRIADIQQETEEFSDKISCYFPVMQRDASNIPDLVDLYLSILPDDYYGVAIGEHKFFKPIARSWYHKIAYEKSYGTFLLMKEKRDLLLKDKQHLIEHLFVNYFFTGIYPLGGEFNDENVIFNNYLRFMWLYMEFQMYLAGNLYELESLTDEELYDFIVAFFRYNKEKLKDITAALDEKNLNSMSGILVLLKTC